MLKCREVSRLVAAGETAELGFWKRLELRLHLLMCRHCQRYVDQMRALGRGARRLARDEEPTDDTLARLEQRIHQGRRDA